METHAHEVPPLEKSKDQEACKREEEKFVSHNIILRMITANVF